MISFDSLPPSKIEQLADKNIRESFENTSFDFIFSIKENDILFIDNSHRILPNSDSMVFYMEVLSKVPKGVLVHIHDINLPYDYPQYICDSFYSEQYDLASFLLAIGKKYKPISPNFFISENNELISIIEPIWQHPNLNNVEQRGGSLWLQFQ